MARRVLGGAHPLQWQYRGLAANTLQRSAPARRAAGGRRHSELATVQRAPFSPRSARRRSRPISARARHARRPLRHDNGPGRGVVYLGAARRERCEPPRRRRLQVEVLVLGARRAEVVVEPFEDGLARLIAGRTSPPPRRRTRSFGPTPRRRAGCPRPGVRYDELADWRDGRDARTSRAASTSAAKRRPRGIHGRQQPLAAELAFSAQLAASTRAAG